MVWLQVYFEQLVSSSVTLGERQFKYMYPKDSLSPLLCDQFISWHNKCPHVFMQSTLLHNNSVDKMHPEGHCAAVWVFLHLVWGLLLQRHEWVSGKRTNWMRAKVRAQIKLGPSQLATVQTKLDQLWFIFTLSRTCETRSSWFVCSIDQGC